MSKKGLPQRQLDILIAEYSQQHYSSINKKIHYWTVPFFSFAVLGLIWAIPFPHIDFLGRYNGFINWASFVIAIVGYYYYRISPVLTYGPLLLLLVYSVGIVQLEKLHTNNAWPTMGEVCLGIAIVCNLVQFGGHKLQGSVPSIRYSFKTLLTGPLWLFYGLFTRMGIRL